MARYIQDRPMYGTPLGVWRDVQEQFGPEARIMMGNLSNMCPVQDIVNRLVAVFARFGECWVVVYYNKALPTGLIQYTAPGHAYAAKYELHKKADVYGRKIRVEKINHPRHTDRWHAPSAAPNFPVPAPPPMAPPVQVPYYTAPQAWPAYPVHPVNYPCYPPPAYYYMPPAPPMFVPVPQIQANYEPYYYPVPQEQDEYPEESWYQCQSWEERP
ncbi:hypothetical protein BDV25DRAFT_138400 [Aspergillus avenaceus]|uniref:RRM domain-containing protein n=1 Tax=Aspergillus avenaceus TaxID=36643 RepID=A0A5N6U001_ASPAV|nr:hypothetical protein BDV25DRAFT_138400 [Aspergillus avenaceus]